MRILFTANCMWNLSHFRMGLIKNLLKDGHEIHALAPYDGYEITLRKIGVRVHNLYMLPHSKNFIKEYKLYKELKKKFDSIKPEYILSYTIKNNIYGAIAARKLNLNFIPNVTGLGTMFLTDKMKKLIAKILYQFAFENLNCIFFQNSDDAQLFIEKRIINHTQAHLLPGSGIDLDRYFGNCQQTESITFLMIARLIREKGLFEYIEVAKRLRSNNADIKFQLIGPYDKNNPSSISELTLAQWINEGIIEYLGVKEDVRPYLGAASCVVLPSYREALKQISSLTVCHLLVPVSPQQLDPPLPQEL